VLASSDYGADRLGPFSPPNGKQNPPIEYRGGCWVLRRGFSWPARGKRLMKAEQLSFLTAIHAIDTNSERREKNRCWMFPGFQTEAFPIRTFISEY